MNNDHDYTKLITKILSTPTKDIDALTLLKRIISHLFMLLCRTKKAFFVHHVRH